MNPESDELLHPIGAFDPSDTKRVIAALEAAAIPFEVEADHSALAKPGRWVSLALGMPTEGSKLAIFVPESKVDAALAEVKRLFPV
ncbi:MAG TPA: hypothetical protein VGD88_03695 [Opitutaceae bacterium]